VFETVVSSSYSSPRAASLIESAVAPEIGAIDGDRTTTHLERSKCDLTVRIEATDPVALRAGQNTWLGLLAVAEEVADAGRLSDRSGDQ
jgi:KEOPS complex subunit Pcc1